MNNIIFNPLMGWKFQQLRQRKKEEEMNATAAEVIANIEKEQKKRRDEAKLQQKMEEEEPEIIVLTDEPIIQSTSIQRKRHRADDVKASTSAKASSSARASSSSKESTSSKESSSAKASSSAKESTSTKESTSSKESSSVKSPDPKKAFIVPEAFSLNSTAESTKTVQNKKESNPKIVFYNEFVKTLPIFEKNEVDLSNTVLKSYAFKNKSAKDKMINKMAGTFDEDLTLAAEKHYWFIFEEPFHKCNNETFEKGHASVSRIPPDFHITLLPEALRKVDLKKFGIKYAVLNITSNWITRFNPDGLNAENEFAKLVKSLKTIFEEAGLRRVVILTCPLNPSDVWSAQNLHNVILQYVIDMKKQRGGVLLEFENYSQLLESSKLSHGEEAFRLAMKTINNKYFMP